VGLKLAGLTGFRSFADEHAGVKVAPLAVIRGTADPANFAPTAAEESSSSISAIGRRAAGSLRTRSLIVAIASSTPAPKRRPFRTSASSVDLGQ